jgi:hypothetical protein
VPRLRCPTASGPGYPLTSDDEGQGPGPTGASSSGADGDEFDALQRRIAAMRREAMDRIESVRSPRPGEPARPTMTPPVFERPAPPRAPVPEPASEPVPEQRVLRPPADDDVTQGADWRWDRVRGGSAPQSGPVPVTTPDADPTPPPAPAPTPGPSPVAGSVIRVSELSIPDLVDVDGRASAMARLRGEGQGSVARVGLVAGARGTIERIAVTRSVAVLGWQALSVIVLIATIAWIVWFPFAAGGSGGRALVVSDARMAPTIVRGDVVVVRSSPDLPYPVGTVVALQQGGLLVTERIVGEERTEAGRILYTRSDGVSVGPDRRVLPQEIVGSVRRIHRTVGYPVLWFTSSSTPLPGLLAIVVLLSSVVGAAALVVRWDLKRSDRALVSAIASGTRTPPQH